ncbi:uncharacterized protein METZ01_LOCUS329840, partial [marine metagenome]
MLQKRQDVGRNQMTINIEPIHLER